MALPADPRYVVHPQQPQSIRGSSDFVWFLTSDAGCASIGALEAEYDADIRVEGDEVLVHPLHILPDIERELKNHWHDYEFCRTMRLKMLSERSAHSALFSLPLPRAALVHFHRSVIVRDARLVELIVEKNGDVAAFGCVDALAIAREMMDNLCAIHLGPLPPSVCPPPPVAIIPHQQFQFKSVERSISSQNVMMSVEGGLQVPGAPSGFMQHHDRYIDLGGGGAEKSSSMSSLQGDIGGHRQLGSAKRERLFFTVRSTDAPRLIGSRGVNKRRIEEVTQCSIILHTEAKKDGEFPVEVAGATMNRCEGARAHIESFLNETGKEEEERKLKERPKVHLAISPRKTIRRGYDE